MGTIPGGWDPGASAWWVAPREQRADIRRAIVGSELNPSAGPTSDLRVPVARGAILRPASSRPRNAPSKAIDLPLSWLCFSAPPPPTLTEDDPHRSCAGASPQRNPGAPPSAVFGSMSWLLVAMSLADCANAVGRRDGDESRCRGVRLFDPAPAGRSRSGMWWASYPTGVGNAMGRLP